MNINSPFSTQYLYNTLQLKKTGDNVDRIGNTLFNSKIKLTPHQIEAALFAFKSPLDKGCILADEVGLGKTIEAGIVLAQSWSEHKRKLLIVTPASLMRQWSGELFDKFNLDSIIMDRKKYNSLKKEGFHNPFNQKEKIIICSHQMCAISKNEIMSSNFDLCIIDEAHKLRNIWTQKNKTSIAIKEALMGVKTVLLTATPIQNNVMDFFGLTMLIDDNIFGDARLFKEKYYKNYSINYKELKERLHSFTHRTLRQQVQPYIKFTNRISKTYSFEQKKDEMEVYNRIRELLLSSDEESYLIPNKQRHLMLLILCKMMGSSIHSIVHTLDTMKKRLEVLLDTGEDIELDFELEYDLEIEWDDSAEKKPIIDKKKLRTEIENLDEILSLAKNIRSESKYEALKDAIDYAKRRNQKANIADKILIFTESKRTQAYIYNSLIADGYEGLVTFNGTNTEPRSKEIYKEWLQRPENFEKLRNSKQINMRQALVDYFKNEGKILIATGAGAEGLNLQFCSTVINYDLPWNPQVVEQRIGRCHRFGQENDVVVINFISSNNVVEQRIYELLSTKFRVFNEIFGSSDAILGTIEEGIDLEKSIVEIYTKCRTTDEINEAFDNIQNQYKEIIDDSMRKTRQELFDNFDEDIQNYFADILDDTNARLNEIEELFWKLTKNILNDRAIFYEKEKRFDFEEERYCISTLNDGSYIDYNLASILGRKVMEVASGIKLNKGNIIFDITNYPFKITEINNLIGKKGYLSLNKLTIESFEKEEYLFCVGFLDDGTPISDETLKKLFRLTTIEDATENLSNKVFNELIKEAEQFRNRLVLISEEKNNKLLTEEIERINNWAEDKIEAVQQKVEFMRNERKNLQKQSDIAENTREKEKIELAIMQLSKKIKKAWIELADAEEDIDEQRRATINKLRLEMTKSNSLESIFTVSFQVV